MDIGKVTVQGLFTGGVHYVVPSFQRRYVWKEDTQWAPLWQDVTDKAAELMKRDDAPPTAGGTEVLPHFLGALVLKQLHTPVGQPIRRLVVDGQQRLTTLQVMVLAIADALMDSPNSPGLKAAGRELRNSLVNPGREDASRYQLRPFANRDFKVFKQLVDGDEPSDDHPLVHCHHYFKSKASDWMEKDPVRKGALIDALFGWIMVVGLNLEPDEDEYVIFEALNARGTPLTEWEKSKNHLLSKSRQTSMGEKEYYDCFIRRFDDDKWWNTIVTLPRFEGSRAELFLNYWLTIKLSQGVQAHRAYYELCGIVKKADLLKMTNSFREYACIFRKLVAQPKDQDHSIQGLFRYRLDVLGITVVMPLMMKLYHMLGAGELFDRCTKVIECFLIRRQVTKWSTREYRDLFVELIKKTSQAPESTDLPVVLVDGLTSTSDWPSDTAIRWSVRQNSASPGVSSRRLRMILEAIEDHITSGMAAYPKAPRNLWIEHLMPIKWQQYWPLADEADERDHADREHAITTLGNLTLTTAALDIHLKNREWEKKRVELEKHDNLFLNKWLLREYYEQWNEETIEERGEFIANAICDIWPSADRLRRDFGLSDDDD